MSVDAPFKLTYSPTAFRDLEQVADALAAQSPDTASRLLESIIGSIDSLAIFPHRNVVDGQPPSANPVRSLPAPPYMIYFRADDRRRVVRILRVRHGARRPLKRFG